MSTYKYQNGTNRQQMYHPLLDDKFFDPTGKTPAWGIGSDNRFSVGDLCNVLERCYKLLLLDELKRLQQKAVERA